ncbi:TAXI family TRAP transporter solute-binding subunit [Amycolatopsis sp. FDAARGOS 1241]|uniref:TAXI family TRAP transporter solute-binding subunit n=1 Tax=Amycolatopsis sp. FDAARGOS 1241 TaxID=2778070 RepID=UPI00194F8E0A|nr:TAXI family TRAP transporter solute-binding subunit [Amycolatopsis sp. FDAARGOS 1241]QRP49661.1 TAXI family TRAP transporter solute-binding subunit [Amycolatopsis sp. FDAARGOS 1241]
MTVTRRTALLGGLALAAAGCAPGYRGPDRSVTIAAGEQGGFYLAFAEVLAAELNRAEPRLHCAAVPTEASVANVERVRDGRADLGLVLADVAQSALAGEPPFPAPVQLRALGRVYENYLQLVVRAGDGVADLRALADRPVSVGAGGSGAAQLGERVFAAAGVTVQARHLPLAEAIAALAAHRIDALLWSGGLPTPALAELNRTTPLALLPLASVIPRLRAEHGPVYEQVQVPAGAYPGVGAPATIGVANLLVCAPGLPPDVPAAVVRVLAGRAANLVPAQAVGTQFLDVRTLIGTQPVPLHAGAADTYRALHG